MNNEELFDIPLRDVVCQSSESQNVNEKVVSKFRVIASHCFALLAIIIFKITQAFNTGFTIILIPELRKTDAEIEISFDDLTWFSSYYFTPAIGALSGGFLTQFIGYRKLLLICGLSYAISGLMFYWSASAVVLLNAQVIAGFIDGMLKGPCYTYLAEVSLPQFRSIFMGCIELSAIVAIFMSTTLGTLLHWRTLALIKIAVAAVGLVLICFVPESPYWLASKNRHEDAMKSLAWLRGWTSTDSVKSEMNSVVGRIETVSTSAENTSRRTSRSSSERMARLKEMTTLFRKQSFYLPFLTTVFVFAAVNFDGVTSLITFSILVFREIDSPIDPHVATIAMTVFRILGSVACIAFISLAGKRKLMFITLASSSIVLIIASAFGYFGNANHITSVAYHWIPIISIFTAVFLNSLGLDKISYILNSEIFPLHVRHVGVGAGIFINSLMNSFMNKWFLYLVEASSMSGTLMCFAAGNVIGCVSIYFIVPETEGKSLKEIEEHYASTKSLPKRILEI